MFYIYEQGLRLGSSRCVLHLEEGLRLKAVDVFYIYEEGLRLEGSRYVLHL